MLTSSKNYSWSDPGYGYNDNIEADLCLLAKYHDIGKVGVPEEILFNPGLLNAYEKEIMACHCEIGYRIAQAVSELSPIADWILKHHVLSPVYINIPIIIL